MATYTIDDVEYDITDGLDIKQTVHQIRQSGAHMEKTNSLLKEAGGAAMSAVDMVASFPGAAVAVGPAIYEGFRTGKPSEGMKAFGSITEDVTHKIGEKLALFVPETIKKSVGPSLDQARDTISYERMNTALYAPIQGWGNIAGAAAYYAGASPETILEAGSAGEAAILGPGALALARSPYTMARNQRLRREQATKELERQELERTKKRHAETEALRIKAEQERMAGPYSPPTVEKALTLQDRQASLTGPTRAEAARIGLELETPGAQHARLNPRSVQEQLAARTQAEPAVNFPLRQEVLDTPQVREITDAYRSEHARMIEEGYKPEEIAQLEQAFGEYMQRYGIHNAADAHGLNRPLYEGVARQLPVERAMGLSDRPTKPLDHTKHVPSPFELSDLTDTAPRDLFKGPGKRQAGAIDFSGFMKETLDPKNVDRDQAKQSRTRIREQLAALEWDIRKLEANKESMFRKNDPQDLLDLKLMREDFKNLQAQLKSLDKLNTKLNPPRGPGKYQAGGINFGVPKRTYEQFKKDMEQTHPGLPDIIYRETYDKLYDKKNVVPFESSVGENTRNAMTGIPGVREALKDIIPDLRSVDNVKPEILATDKKDWPGPTGPGFGAAVAGWGKRSITQVTPGPTMTARIMGSHPLAKFYGDHWSALDDRIYKTTNTLLHDKERGVITAYDNLTAKEQGSLSTLMQQYEGIKWLERAELEAAGMTEKQIIAYNNHRAAMAEVRSIINRNLPPEQQIPDRPGYFPAKFQGEFFTKVWAIDYSTTIKDGVEVQSPGKKILIGLPNANNRYTLNKMIAEIKKTHPEYEIEAVQERQPLSNSKDRAMAFNTFMGLLEHMEKNDPRAVALSELLTNYRAEQTKFVTGISPHFEAKKGIFGSSGRDPFKSEAMNAKDAFRAEALYIQQAVRFAETKAHQEQVVSRLLDPKEFPDVPNIQDYINQHWDRYRNIPSAIAQVQNAAITIMAHGLGFSGRHAADLGIKARKELLLLILGYNGPRFITAQLAQAPQMLPQNLTWLGAKMGAIDAAKQAEVMIKGMGDMIAYERNALTGDVAKAVKWAEDRGILRPRMFEDIRTDIEKHANNARTIVNGEVMIRWSDGISRVQSYLTFYHFLKDAGLSGKELYSTAAEMARGTVTDYRDGARPLLYQNLGTVGAAISPLTTFKHNQYGQYAQFLRDLHDSGYRNPKYIAPVAVALGMSALYSGLNGLIMKEDLDTVLNVLKKLGILEADTPDLTTLLLQGQLSDVVTYGLWSSILDVDLSTTFSTASILPDRAGELFAMPSKALDMAGSLVDLAADRTRSSAYNAAKNWLPQGPAQGWLEDFASEDGMVPDMKHRMEGKYERTPEQQTKRNLGFRDLKEARETTILFKEKERENLQRKQKAKLIERAADAFRKGNDIDKYMEDAFKLGMTPPELMAAIKSLEVDRQTTEQQRFQGVKPRSYNQLEKYRRLQEYQ